MERMLEEIAALTVHAAYSFTGMAFDDIRRRAARTLVALARSRRAGVRRRADPARVVPAHLAALVAASRENVNRALARLVAGGVISQRDRHFVVHDRAALAASPKGTL